MLTDLHRLQDTSQHPGTQQPHPAPPNGISGQSGGPQGHLPGHRALTREQLCQGRGAMSCVHSLAPEPALCPWELPLPFPRESHLPGILVLSAKLQSPGRIGIYLMSSHTPALLMVASQDGNRDWGCAKSFELETKVSLELCTLSSFPAISERGLVAFLNL